jgi:prepilin-type processing-associated H-X9-DG protein
VGNANVLFVDGHARAMTMRDMDDSSQDGVKDNGLWNGKGNPAFR